jgi:hypothetical protein
MDFDVKTASGGTLLNTNRADAIEAGISIAVIGAAMKAAATLSVAAFANGYRAQLASTSAGKLAEYRIKEEIARDPASASELELELLSREAKAHGTNRTGLLGIINAKAQDFRQIALLIGVIEAEANAAIAAIPDDADDIEADVQFALAAAKVEAQTEFEKAVALLSAG